MEEVISNKYILGDIIYSAAELDKTSFGVHDKYQLGTLALVCKEWLNIITQVERFPKKPSPCTIAIAAIRNAELVGLKYMMHYVDYDLKDIRKFKLDSTRFYYHVYRKEPVYGCIGYNSLKNITKLMDEAIYGDQVAPVMIIREHINMEEHVLQSWGLYATLASRFNCATCIYNMLDMDTSKDFKTRLQFLYVAMLSGDLRLTEYFLNKIPNISATVFNILNTSEFGPHLMRMQRDNCIEVADQLACFKMVLITWLKGHRGRQAKIAALKQASVIMYCSPYSSSMEFELECDRMCRKILDKLLNSV